MHEEFRNEHGHYCAFTDEGIIFQAKSRAFFPYGCITKIEYFMGSLSVKGKANGEIIGRGYIAFGANQKAQLKKLIDVAKQKMKTAAPATVVIMEEQAQPKEYRKRCNVCGHIFCYTDSDLTKNVQLQKRANELNNMSVMELVGGTRIASNQQSAAADRERDRIVDYSRCPKCHSADLTDATEADIHQAANGSSPVSAADELKKYKELLDMGVISQEEFDAKKKQLLGL